MGKIIGVDYGSVRVGIAISDDKKNMAFPHAIIVARRAIDEIARVCRDESAEGVVVGYPRTLRGGSSAQTKAVERFAEELKQWIAVPVSFEDERMSTRGALVLLRDKKKQARCARKFDDAVAAALILQTYLDRHQDSV